MDALIEDKPFYDKLGGGITISGGAPLLQYEFSLEILKGCKKHSIHIAIETCMYSKKEILEKFLEYVDFFIVDLKQKRTLVKYRPLSIALTAEYL